VRFSVSSCTPTRRSRTSLTAGSGQYDEPEPPTLSISQLGDDLVSGVVEGILWQDAPEGHRTKLAPVKLDFTARVCHFGEPGFTECTNPLR
jgi:hypothetical protein